MESSLYNQYITERLNSISDLPTLPTVAQKVASLIKAPKTSAADINDAICCDQALAAKVLKLVNSPFYGFPRRITSITYAVVILGFNAIRNIVLTVTMMDSYKTRHEDFSMEAFWKHTIGTAVIAESLAKRVKSDAQDDAFIGGLLHDIGKIIMLHYFNDDFAAVMEEVKKDDCLFLQAESNILQYTHAEIGASLMERWNLPQHLVEAVQFHHLPNQITINQQLCALIHLADILARALLCGNGGDKRIPPIQQIAWDATGFHKDEMDDILKSVRDDVIRASAFFDLL